VRRLLEDTQPGGRDRWTRTNHRGEPITLLEGPAVAAGITAGSLLFGAKHPRQRLAQTIASAGAGAFGVYDDLAEDTSVRSKGLKGHLGALAQGQLTTGGLKVIGIGATAFASALLSAQSREQAKAFDVLLDTVVIAGCANLMNLLDLRPGRALKVSTAAATFGLLQGNSAAAVIAGSAAVSFPEDLGERAMLGDGGANAMGALLGASFVQHAPRSARLACAVGIVGLTLASEKVSFSQVIANNHYLNTVDMWGRRPAHVESESAS
jgi:UDP-N-acetylmuramyl pentapeptide phosphotransferase/UDP-N-acetylglucosamine-1-phosphate transferase